MDGSPIRQKTYAVNSEEQEITADGVEISIYGAITYLGCSRNQLIELDVSKNVVLSELVCFENPLKALDVRKNTALIYLSCNRTQLTELDVSKNVSLIYLSCYNNQLTMLDVSKNTALMSLNCSDNQLTSLDVRKNVALTDLDCSDNPTITTLSIASSYSDVAVSEGLATLITNATSTTGTLNIYGGDNTTVHTAATTKGWTVNTNL